jgi:hypothetical protein
MRSEPPNSDSTLFLGVPLCGLVYRWGINVSETFAASIVRQVTPNAEQEFLQKYRYLTTNLHSDKCQNTAGLICALVSDLPTTNRKFVISNFRREVDENFTLLG